MIDGLKKKSFRVSDNRRMSDKVSNNGRVSDKMTDNVSDNGKAGDNASDKMSDNDIVNDNTHRQAILVYLTNHEEINAATTAKLIDRSPGTARRILSQLANEGVIEATGANRNRKYRLIRR